MAQDIIDHTPVDTGFAKNNWHISLNTPAENRKNTADVAGNDAKQQAQQTIENFEVGDTIYITNNTPYIHRLENGYSPQGQSMVARAVHEFTT